VHQLCRFVLIGPPRSGKTFFRENYLEGKEGKLGVGVTIDEHTLGITTTTKTESEEAKGELGLREKVMGLLKRIMPWIGKFVDKASVDVEELRRILGDRAPRSVVEGARRMIGDSPHRAYYIPWDSDEVRKCMEEPSACAFGADVGKALGLIKEAFGDKKRIKWFRAEYIPPGLVKEVIELIRERGEDGAREVLRSWVNAYFEAIEALSKVLGLGEDLLEWDEVAIGFLSNFVNNYAKYVIGGLAATPLMGAASLALISVLTYMAFKREGEGYLREIIGLRRSLEGLLVKGPGGRLDFNELGGLLVYRVAYAMGMSYDEAKRALMDITGLSIDELERRVNEIERKIKELEKKFELFRQEVPAGIVTADVGEFARGGIYLNIEVEGGELRICVEGQCYNIVRAGRFNELVSEIRDRLLKQGFVVVVGPKGIGKSTLAAAVIWELLVNGDVGRVARVDVLNKENYPGFERFLRNYSREFINYFGRLLILYDPVSTESYERVDIDVEAPVQTNIERTVKNLMNVVNSISPKASRPFMLIVLPSDIYNALNSDMRAKLESHSLDVSQGLINTEFLAGLIREYTRTKGNPNGCALSNDVVNKLAGKVAGFDSGHALIARLIGEELARSNCSDREVKELISKAKGKAETFIILHINGLFKVHESSNAETLVKVFTLRRPFVSWARPGDSILTPGVVKLMGVSELSNWLAIRQHDLIEEAIKKLLDCIVGKGEGCEDLKDADALEPWVPKTVGLLREVSEKVRDVGSAVKYFASSYGKEFTTTLGSFSNKCWKRAALIIGHALAGHPIVHRPEVLPEDVRESIKGALDRCDADYYLLVDNKIPSLIMNLTKDHAYALAEAFVDKYNETVGEVNRILNIARGRDISDAEEFYGLGLASIIAKAVESGRAVEPGDADAALYIASFAIQRVASPDLIRSVLGALGPLRGKAPQRYIELLAPIPEIESLDLVTVRYILNELNGILGDYSDVVRGYAGSLVHAIIAYAHLLWIYSSYFEDEVESVVARVADLLNELGRFKSSLGVIAWAYALAPALDNECMKRLMEEKLGINVVRKAGEVLGGLSKLRKRVKELMGDEEFMSYIESIYIKADEETVKKEILRTSSNHRHALARYRLINDEFGKAEKLFNEAAEEDREIGAYEDYLIDRGWVLRVGAIRGSLVGDDLVKLVDGFRQLYEETFNKKHFKYTARYLSTASLILGNYLVSLALTGDHETISKLLEEHLWVLNANKQFSVPTRLTLNALLSPRGRLSGELEGKLSVNPGELIDAFGPRMHSEFRPALRVAFRIAKPEDGYEECKSIEDPTKRRDCRGTVLAVMDDSDAIWWLRWKLIYNLYERISEVERSGWLRELGFDTNALISEFGKLAGRLDGKSLAQLIAPTGSRARLALILYALINGDGRLARAQALRGTVDFGGKLLTRLFLEAYRACCDLESEGFRRAIAKLFFFHV